MKKLIASLILVSSVAYGQVGTPKGVENCEAITVGYEYQIDPKGTVDSSTVKQVWDEFQRIISENNVTKVVSHYPEELNIKTDLSLQGMLDGYNKVKSTGRYAESVFGDDFDKSDGLLMYIIRLEKDGWTYAFAVSSDYIALGVTKYNK